MKSFTHVAPGRIPPGSFWNWTQWRTLGQAPTTSRSTGRSAGFGEPVEPVVKMTRQPSRRATRLRARRTVPRRRART